MADYGYSSGVNGRRLQDVIRVLRAEGVPWRVLALKQDALTASQLAAVDSGATASTVAQVAQNTANIATLMQTVTAGLRLSYVEELPAVGASNVVYLVPQADGEGVNVCNEYIYINDAYELIGRTGIQVNDGALTITVNGVTVGTFSANQASNTTAAITVPTDTGDLTNNAGYIDATALAGALASYATLSDLASKQDALTDSQLAAVNSGITAGAVAQIAQNADGITTLNILKANNVDVVHITGIETVGGAKTWTATQTFNAGAVGDLTGDVTGDLTGNVTGNLTGDVTGNVTGDVTGDVTGTASRATADASGNVITTTYATKTELSNTDATAVHKAGAETVTGAKTWTALQTFSGGASGNLTGDVTGDLTGNVTGNVTGDLTGNVTGNVTGDLTGTASKATADASGNTITSTYATKTELSTLSTTVGTKANDNAVVHKTGAETIAGAKTFSDTLTGANVVPSATDTYSLGSASVQYNAIYGKSYYYNGTQWGLDQANEWTNTNTFKQNITYERTNFFHQATNPCYIQKDTSVEKGSLVSSAHVAYPGLWHDKNSNVLGYMRFVEYDTGKQTVEIRVSNLIKNGALDPTGSTVNATVNLTLQPSGEKSFSPEQNNDTDLGTSTNKWKTLNGINPGALSLPNLDSYSVITTDFTANLDKTQTTFSWTSPYTGWLHVVWLTRDATEPHYVYVWANIPGTANMSNSSWGQTFSQASVAWYLHTYFPVVAGTTYYFERNWVRSTNDNTTRSVVDHAIFLPTLGNV